MDHNLFGFCILFVYSNGFSLDSFHFTGLLCSTVRFIVQPNSLFRYYSNLILESHYFGAQVKKYGSQLVIDKESTHSKKVACVPLHKRTV